MPPLPTDLRNSLEKTVIAARDVAESAAHNALLALAVERDAPFATMPEVQRSLRRALRAAARLLGGGVNSADALADGLPLLRDEIAYEQWHRMIFARFLAENQLLMHPTGVPVSLGDCDELAPSEGAADGWELAARYAAQMLPGIFAEDDPTVQVRFAPESRHALEALLDDLPPPLFSADDSLGWVYQFWQSKKKAEVNASEVKIGAGTLSPVTQLFTEDYMVRFLLENSLGAWWAARHPDSPLIRGWDYLRWQEETTTDGGAPTTETAQFATRNSPTPAAGTFPGWPQRAADVTVLDPCGGSGHFALAAFEMLRKMRMEEEGLAPAAAGDAVIRDNLFMLEIDPRATQIATFNLLLAAWKSGGYRQTPLPHIACSGIPVEGNRADWLKLARDDQRLATALERLHSLFAQAPTLGSLINPAYAPAQASLYQADYEEVAPLLERALQREKRDDDPAAAVLGAAARGVLRAARLLARRYTLVATNVPYLARGKQDETLRDFCAEHAPAGKNDLATVFLERCLDFCTVGGTTALVLPQNWLFLTSYKALRQKLLREECWHLIARLGEGGFESSAAAGAFTALLTLSRQVAPAGHALAGLDVSAPRTAQEKATGLLTAEIKQVGQAQQLENPDARVVLSELDSGDLFEKYAKPFEGLTTGDIPRFVLNFWENNRWEDIWRPFIGGVNDSCLYGGREQIVRWENAAGSLHNDPGSYIKGKAAWNKIGLRVTQMRDLAVTTYSGEIFGKNAGTILSDDHTHLTAIWCFCSSLEYRKAVRQIDQKLNVTIGTLVKVPFDLDYWQSVAEERYPDGLPAPYSNDPTQWLFNGHPVGATDPLHVAVARLLGYRWPEQSGAETSGATHPPSDLSIAKPVVGGASHQTDQTDDTLDAFADRDGIVCLPPVAGEPPAHERLRGLLAQAYSHPPTLPDFERYRVGDFVPTTPVPTDAGWSPETQRRLLAAVDFANQGLDDWLRDGFFAQHCKLFGNRPFLWHISDGRSDGFHALVNYHKLDRPTLDKLIYTYLGAWIESQRAEAQQGVAGADGRLVAALELKKKLEAIREGEPPYDIYVRWKSLAEQPVGWEPDLNDGVRLNIRPFVEAGVLRRKFTIHWKKDRGKNPDGSERHNDRHYTRAQKLAARG
ncbi:MAG: hypothetical protein KF753_20580 [Caldilineaceae bacterium]|nr:hypothetical protein [Caldilineaceae bacterium]